MRKGLMVALVVVLGLALAVAWSPMVGAEECATIQSGTITATDGTTLTTGYDQWGYNYQAHIFNGPYCYYDRHYDPENPDWNDSYCDIDLQMKWNDAWLSNKDCDGDGLLDRHYGFDSYIGSGAWLTNHMSGNVTYTDDKGKEKTVHWTYFVKIVAVPADATLTDDTWYEADGTEIGPSIWGDFAVIQDVYNDPLLGIHGKQYLSPAGPGLGHFK